MILHIKDDPFNFLGSKDFAYISIHFRGYHREHEVTKIRGAGDLFFNEKGFKFIPYMMTNILFIQNLTTRIIFDCVNRIVSSSYNGGKMEELSVPITITQPNYSGFLLPNSIIPGEPLI